MGIQSINITGSNNTLIEGGGNYTNNNSPTSANSGKSGNYGSSGNTSPSVSATNPPFPGAAEPVVKEGQPEGGDNAGSIRQAFDELGIDKALGKIATKCKDFFRA